MPPKIKKLLSLLKKNGFNIVKGGGKGSHIKLKDDTNVTIMLSGNLGKDADKWQINDVEKKVIQRKINLEKINKKLTPKQQARKAVKAFEKGQGQKYKHIGKIK